MFKSGGALPLHACSPVENRIHGENGLTPSNDTARNQSGTHVMLSTMLRVHFQEQSHRVPPTSCLFIFCRVCSAETGIPTHEMLLSRVGTRHAGTCSSAENSCKRSGHPTRIYFFTWVLQDVRGMSPLVSLHPVPEWKHHSAFTHPDFSHTR